MSISIYRNVLNSEMKRFGKFGKRLAEELEGKGFSIKLVFNPIKRVCLSEMLEADTLIFITHGSATEIFHRFDHGKTNHQILLDKKNIECLRDKKVIAISCGTARNLGDEAYKNGEGCKVYLGFANKIHFTKLNKKEASAKYHVFIGDCYKDTFQYVIKEAILNNWTFTKIKLALETELMRTVTSRALEIQKARPQLYTNHGIGQAILAVSNVANNIKIFGNGNELIG
ncbi:hypothetical protein J2Z69_003463 [Paenibacillus shirakamiensis]|uniref:CHAT domain-containing protein n=1 Tax=Paenibacillus shirakamiensis TaxID=1265935 RepID=A0ABS4JMP1_9BACL|nr:hypothetical protein [Paenibacillus shirakamiensis]MBP2002390.1 hypothetical protein [Paenibacillus shirakamiensis]